MNKDKFYPKIYEDKWWKKFTFQYWDKHFTLRFSWKPMILLEKYFILYWWEKEDFSKLWELATQKVKPIIKDKDTLSILSKAIRSVEDLNSVLDICKDDSKSPFVIYVNDYNSYK